MKGKISFVSSPEVVAWGCDRRNATYSHNWKQYLNFNLRSRRALRAITLQLTLSKYLP